CQIVAYARKNWNPKSDSFVSIKPLGGLLGVLIAAVFGMLFAQFSTEFPLIYSSASIVLALVCSSLIGIGFGFIPARNASKLDPVVALARD
ncbi:hypothetical protein K8R51_37440, partial [Rhizobium favelukesii]|nr:hypothetical protein [Rhizobium favelukesii]